MHRGIARPQTLARGGRPSRNSVVEDAGVRAHRLGEIFVEAGCRIRRYERTRGRVCRADARIEAAAIHAAAECAIDRVRDFMADRHRSKRTEVDGAFFHD